jgi:hypothetical protein
MATGATLAEGGVRLTTNVSRSVSGWGLGGEAHGVPWHVVLHCEEMKELQHQMLHPALWLAAQWHFIDADVDHSLWLEVREVCMAFVT